MIGLLDTHTFIWWDSDRSQLSPAALAFIQDPANVIMLSVVSAWEIQIKVQAGKLVLTGPLPAIIAQQVASSSIRILPISLNHILALGALPTPHKDPFDRLLVAQANVEGAVLLTADAIFAQYPVTVLW